MSLNRQRYYHIITMGCQMNEEDSEKIAGMLEKMGYVKTDDKEKADVIVMNTCAVRENPETKTYGNLGQLKALKAKKPELIIAIGGCMMQQKGVGELVKKKFPYVDIIFGTFNIHRFPELLNNAMQSDTTILEVWEKEGEIVEGLPIHRESDIKAFVTIMHGCNNFCSYCIVPYTRGRERSRKPEAIINEIKQLAKDGYKEVTLLGQNVNSYGKDLDNMSFAKLLRMVNEVEGIERIRFTTSHPKDLTDDVIDAIKECEKVCEHIHLPVQSGSTRILQKMNRKYTKEQYLELVEKIKSKIEDVAITTDIIVGFPGETEEDFEETLDVVKKVEYDSAFTFIYSKRPGTPAEKYEDQVPEDVKHERFNRLVEIVNQVGEKRSKRYQDRIVEVLVEGPSKTDENRLTGRTRTGKLVHFTGGDASLKGKLVNVKITQAQMYILLGELVEVIR
ncbi:MULTISPECIES: tRNA (N6-isopentenyl adenosine(37)-C2)-methylthiotransferase MiaB [Caloramator]|uniref:tRNA-2-methylthio-N(6)-dimethylallyladenosine synthase n=1 Tax=Caloramator australicus RC3 TaxID=857293 RepID=I7LI36_9CLOT|nr:MULTISPECIES: tRNA (N6-isopentenyl adenosine(37)-C2)-methylthiotransferase MiaB [Caloramator]MDO6355438.1 tRNA (N6-isopentenyl adenosine(37)-C2)-methylthiotransferase MiaB [Caloramator sp. CAR-1]CCJ32632.1 tRNA-i(6)A37 methylthiotransferase [Caloramator australicus RC3]